MSLLVLEAPTALDNPNLTVVTNPVGIQLLSAADKKTTEAFIRSLEEVPCDRASWYSTMSNPAVELPSSAVLRGSNVSPPLPMPMTNGGCSNCTANGYSCNGDANCPCSCHHSAS